jgi:hypothetical protein
MLAKRHFYGFRIEFQVKETPHEGRAVKSY